MRVDVPGRVAGDGRGDAGKFHHHGSLKQAAFIRVRRGSAREEFPAGRLDRRGGELRVRGEAVRIVDGAGDELFRWTLWDELSGARPG